MITIWIINIVLYSHPEYKLDFPKGKADQDEEDIECAIREIKEEINLDVRKLISEDRYIKIEVQENKIIKLYIVIVDKNNQ